METTQSKSLSTDKVAAVEIFMRSNPTCSFCVMAKDWIKTRLQGAAVTEYNINNHFTEWRMFLQKHPNVKNVPQITLTMINGSRRHIGGYQELIKAFSLTEQH